MRNIALAFVFLWFAIGGVAHFVLPDFFLKIVPPDLPLRMEAVYISGFFELLGAAALLHGPLRRAAGLGLFLLVIVVTPANVYMWRHAGLFPEIPQILLALRLILQVLLLALIWWSTQAWTLLRR
ncbi:MAG TPA: hypothetical protein VIF60_22895 [Burkholderiaceae bacterium]